MNSMSKMKVLVLVPIGGLANRFYAISSAISFCQMYGIRLPVIWFKDWGMGADFHSLLDLAPILSNIKVVDAHWQDYIYDRPRKRNFWPVSYTHLDEGAELVALCDIRPKEELGICLLYTSTRIRRVCLWCKSKFHFPCLAKSRPDCDGYF